MVKWIGIGLAVLALITIAFIVAGYIYPEFARTSAYIAIVILAVFQMIGAILTAALLIAVMYAVFTIRRLATDTVVPKVELLTAKLDTVIQNTQAITGNFKDTATSVTTTTAYMAEQVVAPVIRVSSLLVGVRAAASFVAKRGQK